MRVYLYRCRACGAEMWTDFIEMHKLACKSCRNVGKWLIMDVKNREEI
jgi:DNA-directed RNA polymerase subunit RPC12/RpoP